MSRPICRDARIDHLDGGLVVAVEDGGGKLRREAKLNKEILTNWDESLGA